VEASSFRLGEQFQLEREHVLCNSRAALPQLLQEDSMGSRIILVLLLLVAVGLSAQTFRGTILGTVTDASGSGR
jgi:hypothetical protein